MCKYSIEHFLDSDVLEVPKSVDTDDVKHFSYEKSNKLINMILQCLSDPNGNFDPVKTGEILADIVNHGLSGRASFDFVEFTNSETGIFLINLIKKMASELSNQANNPMVVMLKSMLLKTPIPSYVMKLMYGLTK